MATLKTLQDEGKIQYIGLNNTTLENLEAAWATGVRFHTLQCAPTQTALVPVLPLLVLVLVLVFGTTTRVPHLSVYRVCGFRALG